MVQHLKEQLQLEEADLAEKKRIMSSQQAESAAKDRQAKELAAQVKQQQKRIDKCAASRAVTAAWHSCTPNRGSWL